MTIQKRSIRFGLLLTAASLTAVTSYAAAPTAGSRIGNQASATYLNAAGDTISVTSNRVETIVQQVAGVTLVTDNVEDASPGGLVFLPHTITNDGNGIDTFTLTATEDVGGPFDFTSIQIFADANFDGVADTTTPITATPSLSAGESFGFVIEAAIPSTAPTNATEEIDVVATSQFSSTTATTLTATNTDTITVSVGAITEIVKAMSVQDTNGDGITSPGDTVTVTLTYSSTGLAPANNLVVTDQLDALLNYVPGSAIWSDSATGLTDTDSDGFEVSNGNGFQIDYNFTTGTNSVEFTVDNVPSGRTATVTFQAIIDAAAPAGDIANVATQTVAGTDFPPSNQAVVTVAPAFQVTAADAAATTFAGDPDGTNLDGTNTSATDDDGALNDIVTENGDVFQGGTITMEFVITNSSNISDTIDLNVANAVTGGGITGFPSGTTFQLVGADGATPIVGPLGPLASGASQRVNVIATLPANAPATAAGATNYQLSLTAQSTNGGLANSVTGLFTGAVQGASIDLTNTGAAGALAGTGPDSGAALITNNTDPGVATTFPLTITNGGPTSDTFDVSLDVPLPAGFTVEFQLPDGTPINNTGVIPGGGSQDILVIVTPPAGQAPGDTPVTVAVTSPTSGQSDSIVNTVSVNQIVDVALTTDQTVQVAPGGVVDIPHVLTNEGNIAITEGSITPSATGGFSTFVGTVFFDANSDGAVDAGDVVLDNINDIPGGIAPGASVPLIHRVQVPSNGAIGLSEAETLTLSTSLNGGSVVDADASDNAVTDTVVITSGDLTLIKLQAVDPACNGTIVGSFVSTDIQAAPGQCIRYQITANNTGTADANAVTIQDTVPGFTTLTECGGSCSIALTPTAGSSIVTRPLEGQGGALESTHGTLIPGAPASLTFTVRIDE